MNPDRCFILIAPPKCLRLLSPISRVTTVCPNPPRSLSTCCLMRATITCPDSCTSLPTLRFSCELAIRPSAYHATFFQIQAIHPIFSRWGSRPFLVPKLRPPDERHLSGHRRWRHRQYRIGAAIYSASYSQFCRAPLSMCATTSTAACLCVSVATIASATSNSASLSTRLLSTAPVKAKRFYSILRISKISTCL